MVVSIAMSRHGLLTENEVGEFKLRVSEVAVYWIDSG